MIRNDSKNHDSQIRELYCDKNLLLLTNHFVTNYEPSASLHNMENGGKVFELKFPNDDSPSHEDTLSIRIESVFGVV